MDESKLRQKSAAFGVFKWLDEVDRHDCEDNVDQAALNLHLPKASAGASRRVSKSAEKRAPPRARSSPSGPLGSKTMPPSLARRNTKPSRRAALRKEPANVIVLDDTPPDVERRISRDSFSNDARAIPQSHIAVPRKITGEKRKREDVIPQLPFDQCIFSDFNIFFFPNDDIDGARRVRMKKSVERGATWVKKWHPNVTHLVVDARLLYADLQKHIGLTTIPSSVKMVKDTYITDCIQFRAVLDPDQPMYCVRGAPLQAKPKPVDHKEQTAQPAKTSNAGLVKTLNVSESKRQHAPKIEATPARTETPEVESDPEQLHPASDGSDVEEQQQCDVDKASRETREQSVELGTSAPNDDLTWAIKQTRATAHLPLEEDDEEGSDSSRPGSANGSDVPAWQQKFQCMQDPSSRPSSSSNPDAHTIELLQQLGNYYDSVRDQWRSRAYRMAVSQLKRCPQEITTAEEARKLPTVGARIADKIQEICRTSRLRRLENALLEPEDQALKTFLGIYGVGYTKAQEWIRQGLRTLQDLKDREVPLTKNQVVGLEHYEDFNTRIPRAEVTKLGKVVIDALRRIDPDFEVGVGGSYRRGAETSGDIDLIISHPTNSLMYTRQIVIETLVPRLEKTGFLTAGLAVTSRDDGTKWHGACVLPEKLALELGRTAGEHRPWRRIDLLLVPSDEMGAAILYFTGNDIFNRSMRLLARKKGMCLNQRGLYKGVIRDKGNIKLNEGHKIAGRHEKDIFRALGVPWRECTERDC